MVIKTVKSSTRNVRDFIETSDHSLSDVLAELREIVLNADKNLTEQIKWNAPSFCIDGEDLITANLSKEDRVLLVFHRGAKTKEKLPEKLIDDTTGLLNWAANDRATVAFISLEDVSAKKAKLKKLVKQWIAATK